MILGDPNRPPQPDKQLKPEMAPPFCAKCAGEVEMQLGFIPDHGHFDAILQPEWSPAKFVEGAYNLTLHGQRYTVRTYRCPQCGYLESYAPNRWE